MEFFRLQLHLIEDLVGTTCFGLVLEGKSQKEIAHETGTQITTVATYKSRLLEKPNVHSLLELNKLAVTYNLI